MTINLYRRSDKKSCNWMVRLVAPRSIAKHLPAAQRDIRRSTGTPDKRLALVRAAQIEADVRGAWEVLKREHVTELSPVISKPAVLSDSLITQICGARLLNWIQTDDGERSEGLSDAELASNQNFTDDRRAQFRSVVAQGPKSQKWVVVTEEALDWAAVLGHQISPEDPLVGLFVRKFAEVETQSDEVVSRRNSGESVSFPEPVGLHLPSEVLPLFEKHRSQIAVRKVVTTDVHICKLFIAYVKDLPLDKTHPQHVFDFLEARMHDATKPWSQSYALGRAKQVLEHFFAYARTQDLMTTVNPVTNLEVQPKVSPARRAAQAKPRYPFNDAQLTELFASDWYKPQATRWQGKMRTDLAARYWIPLICLFHGLRVSEAIQLRVGDFSVSQEILLVSIKPDEHESDSKARPARSLKNVSSARTIPVHPQLIELGLQKFVFQMQRDRDLKELVFPSAMPRPGGKTPQLGRAYEQPFLKFVKDTLNFGKGHGNHSFRHTVEDRIRDAQTPGNVWPAGLAQFYMGRRLVRDYDRGFLREQGSEVLYGKGFGPANVLAFIKNIDYSGVEFPVGFAMWLEQGEV